MFPLSGGVATARVERMLRRLTIAACVFYAAVAAWEAFGPLGGGHVASAAGNAIGGENMVRWRMFAIVPDFVYEQPKPDLFYCHHPYGVFLLDGLAYFLFGHRWFSVRIMAIACSALSPPLVYGFGRKAWGEIPAAIATLFFTLVPMNMCFSNFGNLEVPTIFFGLFFMWATANVWQSWRRRDVALAAVGAVGTCNCDWVGIVIVGVVLGFAFVRGYVLPRRFAKRGSERAHAQWFAYACLAILGTVLLYMFLFGKADKIGDFMFAYHKRAFGSETKLSDTIMNPRRLFWASELITPFGYVTLAAGIPLSCLLLVRRPLEIFPIAFVVAATFEYLAFKQAADTHVFWSHYYGPSAALAAGTLSASVLAVAGALVRRLQRTKLSPTARRRVQTGLYVALGLVAGISLLLMGRMAIAQTVQGRKTADRLDQKGAYIGTDSDGPEFAQWAMHDVVAERAVVQVFEHFDFNNSAIYGATRPHVGVTTILTAKPEDPQRVALVDTRGTPIKDLAPIALRCGVEAVGPFWRVDRAVHGPSFKAIRYTERQPTVLEWLFVTGTDLVRTIGPDEDAYTTWEWKDALGLPNAPPTRPPATVGELRIAHNIAVSTGDQAHAKELAAEFADHVGRNLDIAYSGGVHLRGVDTERGAATVTTLYWETDASFTQVDTTYKIRCKVTKAPLLWLSQTDTAELDLAPVPVIRPGMWKPGYLYVQRFVATTRIGRDECRGAFAATLHPLEGDQNPLIAVYE
jgi:hypothetical protein